MINLNNGEKWWFALVLVTRDFLLMESFTSFLRFMGAILRMIALDPHRFFNYLKPLIRTTFVAHSPRTQARYLPPRDQSKPKMRSVSNAASSFGAPPSSG